MSCYSVLFYFFVCFYPLCEILAEKRGRLSEQRRHVSTFSIVNDSGSFLVDFPASSSIFNIQCLPLPVD